ncbi:MAG: hypothetical protein V4727_03835 [Verrucomicrobiota bacterium]
MKTKWLIIFRVNPFPPEHEKAEDPKIFRLLHISLPLKQLNHSREEYQTASGV